MRAGRRGLRRARHRPDQAFSAWPMPPLSLAAWQDRPRLPADRDRRPGARAAAAGRALAGRLGVDGLHDAGPVLSLLRLLVRPALEQLPAATASIGTLLVPVVGVLGASAMLNEPLGLREITALAFTLGGVAVALRS